MRSPTQPLTAKTKIVLCSPFFYPETISTGKYNAILARALADLGAAVEVITSHPLYPSWKPAPCREQLDGIRTHRGGASMFYPRPAILRRLVLETWFAAHAARKAFSVRKGTDVLLGIFPPNLFYLPVSRIMPGSAFRIGIVHDLQGILGVEDGSLLKRLFSRLIRTLEGSALRSCDKLVMLSSSMAARAVQEYGLNPAKVVVQYPFVTVSGSVPVRSRLVHLFPRGAQHVVYSGALGKKQNPRELLRFFQTAASRLPDVCFHVFSEGPMFDDLVRQYHADPGDRVQLHPLVEECDLEELYARSTIQVVPQAEGTSDGCLPSKLPNILASGCAVFAICDSGSEVAGIIRQAHSGAAVHSWDIDVLVSSLQQLLRRTQDETRQQRQALAAELIAQRFSLQQLVDTIVAGRSASALDPESQRPHTDKVAIS